MASIAAKDLKEGNQFLHEGRPIKITGIQVSKLGKHGRSKVRIEAKDPYSDDPLVLIKPADELIEVIE